MSYREFLNKLLLGNEGGASSWEEITDKPSAFPPSAHTHAQADVTGLTDIAAKAHTHANKATLDKLAEADGKLTFDGAEIGGGGTVDESRLLPDSGPDDSWMHHSESMDLVTPTDMKSMQSADWTLTAENVQENFSCKPWGLFDSFANSGYLFSTTTGPSNCTWTRRDGTPTLIDRLELYAGSASQRNGDSYEFYGSHNGSNWILLGSWENTNWRADSVGYDNGDYYVLTLEVNNDTKYLHYKFVSPSTSLNGLKGYGVTTKNEWKKFPEATSSKAGAMSAADKAKLDKFDLSNLAVDDLLIGTATGLARITLADLKAKLDMLATGGNVGN